jgi:hypothetical protein
LEVFKNEPVLCKRVHKWKVATKLNDFHLILRS